MSPATCTTTTTKRRTVQVARKRRGDPVHGWVILDKPAGVTSTQAVGAARRACNAAKAGHAGTLDPLATGILPIALGEATKVVSLAMDQAKAYRFTVKWGEERATDDTEGEITARSDSRPGEADIRAALAGFTGMIEQVPPTYSAIKVSGERAYDLARDGRPPELTARRVRIDALTLTDIPDGDHACFELACGKGTYVRSLARDIGRQLGCLGHVTQLRRTRVGPFRESDAISLDKVEELGHKGALVETLLPVETALVDIPALVVTGSEANRLKCGQAIRVPNNVEGTVYAMADSRLIALARAESGEVRPVRVFNL
jgi:tRNA pseudouridine55 synthase